MDVAAGPETCFGQYFPSIFTHILKHIYKSLPLPHPNILQPDGTKSTKLLKMESIYAINFIFVVELLLPTHKGAD
jgi:hypothetical protein